MSDAIQEQTEEQTFAIGIRGGGLQCVKFDGHTWSAEAYHCAEQELRNLGMPSTASAVCRHLAATRQ